MLTLLNEAQILQFCLTVCTQTQKPSHAFQLSTGIPPAYLLKQFKKKTTLKMLLNFIKSGTSVAKKKMRSGTCVAKKKKKNSIISLHPLLNAS